MRIRISRQDTSSGGVSISIFVEEREGKQGAEYHEVGKDDYYWLCRSISRTIFKMLASEPPANNASTGLAHTCGDCGAVLQEVRPGKYQCDCVARR